MNNNRILLSFICLVLSVMSCKKKEYPVSSSGTPVFYFKGTVNGLPVNIQSGINNYYMNASYALDGNGAYDFTGEFKDYACSSGCPNSLKIYLKDYRQYSVLPTTIDSSIITGYYSFASSSGAPSKYYFAFQDSLYNGTAPSRLWDFGDGATSTKHNPSHTYTHPGVYKVSLTCQSGTLYPSSLNNDLIVGQVGNAFAVKLLQQNAILDTVFFTNTIGGVSPTWIMDFGDGSTTTSAFSKHFYAAPGVYKAKLTVTDATGYTSVCNLNAATQTTTISHTTFQATGPYPSANPTNLSDVTIEWRDATGILYTTSTAGSQPSKSVFKVISIDNYLNNPAGQPTKKAHATITCTLYNGSKSIILNGDVVFSIAHL